MLRGHQPARHAVALYEQLSENHIEEAQIDLFGRRARCHKFAVNQLCLLLAALAYAGAAKSSNVKKCVQETAPAG